MHMVVWRWTEFFFPVELLDLPPQFADVCPPCPVHRRDPARPQIAITVNQELHVFRYGPSPAKSGLLRVLRNRL